MGGAALNGVTIRNLLQGRMTRFAVAAMPIVRFVREGRDVLCPVGTNLRELALAEGVELYGLKGRLGNCGGCGQCITCFVEVVAERGGTALTPRTAVEDQKLRRRPDTWRLACQSLVQESVAVLTRPQNGRDAQAAAIAAAQQEPLPEGRIPLPQPEVEEEMVEESQQENDEL